MGSLCRDCFTISFSNGFASISGCVCTQGYKWSSILNQCIPCPSGSSIIDGLCVDCTSTSLPAGTTSSGCQTCSNTQGFISTNSICLKCSQSILSNGSASAGNCSCKNNTMVWSAPIQTCSCYFYNGYFSTYSSGQVNCISCSTTATGCICGDSTTSYDPDYKICTYCPGV